MKRLPGVNYFAKSATIPDITLGEPQHENMFVRIPLQGDKLTFAPFNLRFMVDEDLTNYLEIYNWMIGLGFPDDFLQSIHKAPGEKINEANLRGEGTASDATLTLMTSHRNPNVEVTFVDMFPISLSSLEFNVEETDIQYLQADVTFAYRKFSLNVL
jgi:hypothetical protein